MKVEDNSLGALRDFFMKELTPLYGERESSNLFRLACEHYYKMDYRRSLNLSARISESEMLLVFYMVKRLKKFEPIQYITGKAHFLDLELSVGPGVLIPRPETEELVQWVIDENPSPLTIVDLCTGSACIPLALKNRFPGADVIGIDISDEALVIARKNTQQTGLNVRIIQDDVLKMNELPDEAIDVLVSNPPYVDHLDKSTMSPNVLEYEPHLALFPEDEDVLIFYRKIAALAMNSLKSKGKVYVEIHEKYGPEVVNIFCESGLKEVVLKSDISDKPRMVRGIKP